MTRQNISVGSAANDGTGDTLRSAGTKINNNFREIYTLLADSNTVSTQISLTDSAVRFNPGSNEVYLSAQPSITADRDIRLPDANGVVTLNNATQTLTNKTISLNETILNNTDISSAGNVTNASNTFIRVSGSTYGIVLDDGTTVGEIKVFASTASGNVTITPANFAQGSSFQLAPNDACTCIWNGTNWFLIGNQSSVTVS